MKSILFATDFSPCSMHAFEYCLQLSVNLYSQIVVLHVGNDCNEVQEEFTKIKELAMDYTPGISVRCICQSGIISEVIQKSVSKLNISLVVTGTEGINKHRKNGILGSTAINIINHCDCPVLAVPLFSKISRPIKVVLATDYHVENAVKTFKPLSDLANYFNSEIVLLNITDASHGYNQMTAVEKRTYIAALKANNVVMQDLRAGELLIGIKDFCREFEPDLIAMVPSAKHEGKLVSQSNTANMIWYSNIPLLALQDEKNIKLT